MVHSAERQQPRYIAGRMVAFVLGASRRKYVAATPTIRKCMPKHNGSAARGDQRWVTFLRNPANAIGACNILVAVTASFRLLYIVVVIQHDCRKLLPINVTSNPAPNERYSTCVRHWSDAPAVNRVQ